MAGVCKHHSSLIDKIHDIDLKVQGVDNKINFLVQREEEKQSDYENRVRTKLAKRKSIREWIIIVITVGGLFVTAVGVYAAVFFKGI